MYYVFERIQKICNELKSHVYKNKVSINSYKMLEGKYLNIEAVEKAQGQWRNFETGDLWGGRDRHCWFRTKVQVPVEFQGQTIALNLKTFDEGWDAVNPQFILYIDGEHIQGLDINHREVILTDSAEAGKVYNVDLHAYGGMVADRKASLYGELVLVDKLIRELYFNIQVPIWVCEKLSKEDKRRIDMLNVLNEAVNILDLRKVYSNEYYKSVSEANEFLKIEFYEKLCGKEDVIATCVGHTHIDVAWQWTVAQTREKAARSFSTVLKLMEQYPEYKFMSSQPVLYKFLKEDYPKVYEKVKEKVKEGVWEPEGAMWLEADCNVTSGESLVRQILFGKRFFEKEFGVKNEILWLPDVFGYSAALPQILKKSDINYFMTTKISWNQFNKMPYDTFMWKGIDGTEVLTHFITTKDPYQDPNMHFTTYNGQIHPGAIMGAWERYQQKNINDDVLVCYGFGDGGGGATYEMLEVGRRLNKGIPGCPKVEMGTAKDYFRNMEEKVKGNRYLPKWSGELYLEYHRGTYTSMARNKRDNRLCENLYEASEKFNSFNTVLGGSYPQEALNKGWENILLNQFHDILPGSSIQEVYEVTKEEYRDLLENGTCTLNKALSSIAGRINLDRNAVVVFNSLSYERNDITKFSVPENIVNPVLFDEEGKKVICQRIEGGKAVFFANGIPAQGYKTYYIVDEQVKYSDSLININSSCIENDFFEICLDEKGQIECFYDKRNNRELLKSGEKGNVLQAFEDKPMNFDNWDIDIFYKEKMWNVDDIQKIEVVEDGPVRAALKVEKRFLDSTIIQKIFVYRDIDRVDFETYVDWKQSQVLLKVAFPIDINTNKATYEIQYGNIERPTHSNTSWDVARFEVCGQKWADISEGDFGVSLLNNCKYGHDIQEGTMRLTLIKSGIEPNPTTDQEEHYFTYSIYPHSGEWKDSETVSMAYNLNVPLYTTLEQAHKGELPLKLSFINVDKNNVMIEAVKKAEDGDEFIVRMYEFHNKRSKVTMEFFKDIVSVNECSLMEKDIKAFDIKDNKIEFVIKPFEIKTFKVQFK
ncbi:alpha-mannosidase [Clostridium folliculivorans]|uniref:Alpha-mannosidase n=1 Tax=Clostridium folliculivorans TaxID=2886038 RepID=A0A9W5Y5V9_9CLOT|nr:alpha-mannosidase [Clostridium folliculivorans]GKU27139.1 alpha-mannosidase [Clostridium folliculivorans]GKU31756.1 alpha-mannosidase [Clostridium folliculivorans]